MEWQKNIMEVIFSFSLLSWLLFFSADATGAGTRSRDLLFKWPEGFLQSWDILSLIYLNSAQVKIGI